MYWHFDTDRAYPLRSKRMRSPDRYEEETLENVTHLDATTELIARASYRLGHAEAVAQTMQGEAKRANDKVEGLEKDLSEARDSKNYYKRDANREQERREAVEAELTKANAKLEKLKPKKTKKAVQGGRTTRN